MWSPSKLLARRWVWVSCLMLGSCSNFFRDVQDKTSDTYLLDRARRRLDLYQFDKALEDVEAVRARRPSDVEVITLAITAYAGRAGLRSLDFLLELGNIGGTQTFFKVFAEHFPKSDLSDVEDMEMAVTLMEGITDDSEERSSEENLFALFIYFGRIGVILNHFAYDEDNARDPTFDACSSTSLSDLYTQKIMNTLPRIIEAASGLDDGSGIGDSVSEFVNSPALTIFSASRDKTCPADTVGCDGLRSLIEEGDAGIGIGAGPVTPCP